MERLPLLLPLVHMEALPVLQAVTVGDPEGEGACWEALGDTVPERVREMDTVPVPLTVEERSPLPVPASTALADTEPDRLTVAL